MSNIILGLIGFYGGVIGIILGYDIRNWQWWTIVLSIFISFTIGWKI